MADTQHDIAFNMSELSVNYQLQPGELIVPINPLTGYPSPTNWFLFEAQDGAVDTIPLAQHSAIVPVSNLPYTAQNGRLFVTRGEIDMSGMYENDMMFELENIIMQQKQAVVTFAGGGMVNFGGGKQITRTMLISTVPWLPQLDPVEFYDQFGPGGSGLTSLQDQGFGAPMLEARVEGGGVTGTQYSVGRYMDMERHVVFGRHDVFTVDASTRIPADELGSYDLKSDPTTVLQAGFTDQVYKQMKLVSSQTWGGLRDIYTDKLYVTQVFFNEVADRRHMADPIPTAPSDNPSPANASFALAQMQINHPAVHMRLQGRTRKMTAEETLMRTAQSIIDWDGATGYAA